jgi:hypothetical protein
MPMIADYTRVSANGKQLAAVSPAATSMAAGARKR